MERSLLLCCCSIWSRDWFVPRNVGFVECIPKKCFNKFLQSADLARQQSDENPNSNVVADTMKLPANSSYGYHITDRSRHTKTKYSNDEKTHSALNTKLFKKLDL